MSLLRLVQRTLLVLALLLVVTTFARPFPDPLAQFPGFDTEDDEEEPSSSGLDLANVGPREITAVGGRLYLLSQSKGAIITMGPNGESPTTFLAGLRTAPDGIAVDKAAGHIYWSNMRPGTIERININGSGRVTIVPSGVFKVGKQIVLVTENGVKKLYWCDREGMKVMRANVDGSRVEVLVDTSRMQCTGRECKWAVGVAVDTRNGWVYWTQKGSGGSGSIHRVPIKMQAGQTAANRNDVQTVLDKLPEPIDLRWVDGYGLYWTDRGHAAGGNSVNRMSMTAEVQAGKAQFAARGQILATGLNEGIGIAVDVTSNKMWFTELGGRVFQSNLDGSGKRTIATGQGILTGIDYVP